MIIAHRYISAVDVPNSRLTTTAEQDWPTATFDPAFFVCLSVFTMLRHFYHTPITKEHPRLSGTVL